MIRQIFIGLCCASLATSLFADVFTPIDVRKKADVNGKAVEMPVLNFEAVPQPVRRQPVSPLTGKAAPSGKVIESKTVDLETLAPYSTVPAKRLPMANFTPRQGRVETPIVPQAEVATPTVPAGRARTNERVIRPTTPAGEQDLKEQFRKTP
ncbi:MAG: hypothetical protein PCFJNLEI_03898 [Verrucomicrobiae bacterium]|nr:hypothetical protein [Verrucomicrobiae bacterium]